ncbi:MAG: response regulator transcription factor [Anaerolineales bacterium]|nr:response regulator transcription factor [Anaerolineales bacterium]
MDVLVVDDDGFARSGLSLYLASLGYQVRQAGDVQTAWQLVLAAPPALAVLNVVLPLQPNGRGAFPAMEPHGLGLAQRLKKAYPTMGLVLLSAHAAYEREVLHLTRQHVRSVAFLHKGGDMGRLEVALQEVLAGRSLPHADGINRYALATAVTTHFSAAETPWIEQAVAEFASLSPREQEVAHLLAASHTTGYIAARLGLNRGSVDNIVSRIYARLGLADLKNQADGLRPLPILIKACLLHDIQHRL